MKKAVVVLPTYNERDNIKTLIPAILAEEKNTEGWNICVLVVDDTSPDGTYEEVLSLKKKYKNIEVIQGKKQGLGRAYIRGFEYALEKMTPDTLFEMDADWSHPPSLIPQFLEKIDAGVDFVIGARYIKGGSIPQNWELYRKILSWGANLTIRLGFMILSINDWTSGYRAIRANHVKEILPNMGQFNGYVFQVALLDKAHKKHLKIDQVPLRFEERQAGMSKINALQYIYNTLLYVFQHSSFIKFAIVGFIGFAINLTGLEIFYRHGFTPAIAAAIGAEISIVSNFLLNNFWSFSHKKIPNKTHYLPKFLHFNAVSFGSIVIQFVVVGLGTHFFGDHSRVLFLIISVLCFIMPYSYFMYNRFIWKGK